MLLGIKLGRCSCWALAGAKVAAVCDYAISNCQLLCQKCHLTCCSLLHVLCRSFHKLRAWTLPQTAAHSTAPSLSGMTLLLYPPPPPSLFSHINRDSPNPLNTALLEGTFEAWHKELHESSNLTQATVSPRGIKSQMAGGWVLASYGQIQEAVSWTTAHLPL